MPEELQPRKRVAIGGSFQQFHIWRDKRENVWVLSFENLNIAFCAYRAPLYRLVILLSDITEDEPRLPAIACGDRDN